MRIINDYHSVDPYFNLAAEEYFLTQSTENVCRFWQNENTVVIGKHQALPAEVNTKIAKEKGIRIARRISGGGTVYHDLGNLNFTFISNNLNGENLINFKQFTEPIKQALLALDLPIEHNDRSDLLLDGFKVSGNAEHLSQKLKRTLHHGTLLFNSDLKKLGAVLKTPIDQFEGKFVHSKRSKVANISDYIKLEMDMKAFRLHLETYFNKVHGVNSMDFTETEIEAIKNLAEEKYQTDEWVLGYSPKFKFNFYFEGERFLLFSEKGRIVGVEGNHPQAEQVLAALQGQYFLYSAIKESILKLDWEKERMLSLLNGFFEI